MKTLLTLSLLSVLSPFSAQADVNMKDASYYKTWIDLEVVSKDSHIFQLRRTYSSRSLHPGIFGFGWCSDYEKRLDLSRSDQISLQDCRLSSPIRYRKKTATLYEASDNEKIELKDGLFTRTTAKKTQQKYNQTGQLITLLDKNQKSRLDLTYDRSGFLQNILINQKVSLKIKPDLQKRHIQSVTIDGEIKATYRYEGANLVQTQNAWKNRFTYDYDNFHNLTRVQYPDKSFEALTYDSEKDWILQIQNRDKCLETFKFSPKADSKPGQNFTSTAEKRCAGKLITTTSYEFRHKARADGSKYLEQVQVKQGSNVQRISYQNQRGLLNESP